MAGHEIPQPSAQLADQPTNPDRRLFMKRTGETIVAAGVAAVASNTGVNLFLPHDARAARREPEGEPQLSADAIRQPQTESLITPESRAREIRQRYLRLRDTHPVRVANLSVAAAERIEGVTSFGPGDKVDRIKTDDKVAIIRADDWWWGPQGHEFLDVVEDLQIPIIAFPVGINVEYFPDVFTRAYAMKDANGKKLVEWGNHTDNHDPIDNYSNVEEVMSHLSPQEYSLITALRRKVPILAVAPPYEKGAKPGEPTNPMIVNAAKRNVEAVMGRTLYTGSLDDGATVNGIVNTVINGIRKGHIILTHPIGSGIEGQAMRRWAEELLQRGWKFGRLSDYANRRRFGKALIG